MSFNSFRRHYLDQELEASTPLFQGKVLDLGGVRVNRRGKFRIPQNKQADWVCLNQATSAQADIVASVPPIPVADSSFDTVLCSEVLEYINNPAELLKEVHRVLKSRGTLILSVPFVHPLHGDAQYDCWRFTSTGMRSLLKGSFEIERLTVMGGFLTVVLDLQLNLSKRRLSIFDRVLIKCINSLSAFVLFFDKSNEAVNTGYFLVARKVG